jgi:hypothetical protein
VSDPCGSFDVLEPRRPKVAIVGFATSTRDQAPFADQSWEVWGMNQLYRFLPRLTRWFEIHTDYVFDMASGTDYVGWMRQAKCPIYMSVKQPDIPNAIAYPLERMIAEFDLGSMRPQDRAAQEKGYFHSTVDYMLALAISEGFQEIGVWGIDMAHDTEYVYQKPSASFWLGVARGRGIRVTLPPASALLNSQGYRYGMDPEPSNETLNQLTARRKALEERKQALVKELDSLEGSLQENAHWTEFAKHIHRGGILR